MVNKILYISFFVCWQPLHTESIVILIPGTWAEKQAWHKPGNLFFDTLEREARQQHRKLITFNWSCKLAQEARIQAAYALVTFIQQYNPATTFIIIAHSHGGNIAIRASHLLAQQATSHTIEACYTLGTPFDPIEYTPAMQIINHFYNLFSWDDFIQTVGGFYERTLPTHARIANIAITMHDKAPNHYELHDPVIARWILHLPPTTAFDAFQPWKINFYHDQSPFFDIDYERDQLLDNDRIITQNYLLTFSDILGKNEFYE